MTNWTIINEKYIDIGNAHVLCDNAITAEIICAIHNAQIKPVAPPPVTDNEWISTEKLPVVPPGSTVSIDIKHSDGGCIYKIPYAKGYVFDCTARRWRFSQ